MHEQYKEAIDHIKKRLAQGVPLEYLRMELVHNKWSQQSIDYVMSHITGHAQAPHPQTVATKQPKPKDPNNTRNAILWICSPVIIWVAIAVVQFVLHLTDLSSPLTTIVAVLAGIASVVLFFVGPIIGVIKLIDND
jgi:hypothetical protein